MKLSTQQFFDLKLKSLEKGKNKRFDLDNKISQLYFIELNKPEEHKVK